MRSEHCKPFFRNSSTEAYAKVAAVPWAAMRSGPVERRCHLAAADVEVDRQARLLRDRPQRVPVRLAEERQPEAVRLAGEEDPAVAGVDVALDLLDRFVDVPERHGHDREQAARVGRRPVAQEVVVRAHAHELELVVGDPQEPLAAEPGDVRVEHLGPDADLVHVPQAGVGVVGRGRALLERLRARGERLGPPRDRGETGAAERDAVEHPDVAAVVVALDVRHVLEVALRHAGGPHVGRLGEMRVRVDDELRHAATVRQSGALVTRAPHEVVGVRVVRCVRR